MEKPIEVLEKIRSVYEGKLDDNIKREKISNLWVEYYKLRGDSSIFMDELERNYSDYYFISQDPKYENISMDKVSDANIHLEEVIFNNNNGKLDGITMEEVKTILDCVVYKVRRSYVTLGVDIFNNSLNGYCDLGQRLSILPLEKLGLKVTKNSASKCFEYPFNHSFGTVTFPVLVNGVVEEKTFLIDTTYRRFFTSIKCNEGMYYKNDNIVNSPDPGYFVKDIDFVKSLMRDGYVILNDYNAKCYGEPFYLSSLEKEDMTIVNNINYLDNIMSDNSDYALDSESFDGLEVRLPKKR